MLAPATEPGIDENTQPYFTIITGVVKAPQYLNTPVMQEFIADRAFLLHESEQDSSESYQDLY